MLIDGMRVSARQAKPFIERQRMRQRFVMPLAAAASLAIGVTATSVTFVKPLQSQLAAAMQMTTPKRFVLEENRGDAGAVLDHRQTNELLLQLDPVDLAPGKWTIVDHNAHVVMARPVSADQLVQLGLPI